MHTQQVCIHNKYAYITSMHTQQVCIHNKYAYITSMHTQQVCIHNADISRWCVIKDYVLLVCMLAICHTVSLRSLPSPYALMCSIWRRSSFICTQYSTYPCVHYVYVCVVRFFFVCMAKFHLYLLPMMKCTYMCVSYVCIYHS
jgi:hypothetical protein